MFLVFAYPQYYPSGGMDDCIGRTQTLIDAIDLIDSVYDNDRYDYADVYDLDQDLVVIRYEREEHFRASKWIANNDDFYDSHGYNATRKGTAKQ